MPHGGGQGGQVTQRCGGQRALGGTETQPQPRRQGALADVDQDHAQREFPALGAQCVGAAGVAAALGADIDAATQSAQHTLFPDIVLSQLTTVAAPLMPSIKARARAELPNVIRRETDRFGDVPFAAMVIGADRYLEITTQGDFATVRSKLPEHDFEVKMRRNGTKWQVVGVRDEDLSTSIAQAIGEQIIGAATGGNAESAGKRLGIRNMENLLREVEKLLE